MSPPKNGKILLQKEQRGFWPKGGLPVNLSAANFASARRSLLSSNLAERRLILQPERDLHIIQGPRHVACWVAKLLPLKMRGPCTSAGTTIITSRTAASSRHVTISGSPCPPAPTSQCYEDILTASKGAISNEPTLCYTEKRCVQLQSLSISCLCKTRIYEFASIRILRGHDPKWVCSLETSVYLFDWDSV